MITIFEIKGYDTVNTIEKTLYFSDTSISPFSPADADRPNTDYIDSISDIGSYKRSMFGGNRTSGKSSVNAGSISIDNTNGNFDYLHDWGFSGRAVTAYKGEEGAAFNTFTQILNATIAQATFNFDGKSASSIDFSLADRQSELSLPIQQTLYAGTNSGATGNEGLATDIKDTPKPLCFGRCFNISPVPCNTSALRYQIHDGAINAVNAVRDKGVALTAVAYPPAAGQYSVDLSTGIITLGSSPVGTVTADVEGAKPSGTYHSTVGDIVNHILINHAGIIAGDIVTNTVSDLNTSNSSVVGIFVKTKTDIIAVIDELMASIGGFCLFNQLGKVQLGVFTAPSVTELLTINDDTLMEISLSRSSDNDKGIPVHLVNCDYKKNFTPQKSDSLAGGVSDVVRAELDEEYRTVKSEDASIEIAYLLSPEVERKTLLAVEANALTESLRLLNLYKVKRQFYKVSVPDIDEYISIDLNDTIEVIFERFGLDAGKNFTVISVSRDTPDVNMIEFELWG